MSFKIDITRNDRIKSQHGTGLINKNENWS